MGNGMRTLSRRAVAEDDEDEDVNIVGISLPPPYRQLGSKTAVGSNAKPKAKATAEATAKGKKGKKKGMSERKRELKNAFIRICRKELRKWRCAGKPDVWAKRKAADAARRAIRAVV